MILWGCSKSGNVAPTDPVKTNPDTIKKLTRDDSIHMVAFIIYPQKVKTTVSGKTLTMVLNEDVSVFLLAEAYQKTSAIHIMEDFKSTTLGAFDFTTVNEEGQTVYNYIENNLNNIKTITISDTTINGANVVKVNLKRLVTFSKTYASNQLATDQQNIVLGKTNELLTFSSYTYYNQKNYPPTSAVAYLKYEK